MVRNSFPVRPGRAVASRRGGLRARPGEGLVREREAEVHALGPEIAGPELLARGGGDEGRVVRRADRKLPRVDRPVDLFAGADDRTAIQEVVADREARPG